MNWRTTLPVQLFPKEMRCGVRVIKLRFHMFLASAFLIWNSTMMTKETRLQENTFAWLTMDLVALSKCHPCVILLFVPLHFTHNFLFFVNYLKQLRRLRTQHSTPQDSKTIHFPPCWDNIREVYRGSKSWCCSSSRSWRLDKVGEWCWYPGGLCGARWDVGWLQGRACSHRTRLWRWRSCRYVVCESFSTSWGRRMKLTIITLESWLSYQQQMRHSWWRAHASHLYG